MKVNPLNFPWFYQVPQTKFEANRSCDLLSLFGYPNKKTNRNYYFIYTYLYVIYILAEGPGVAREKNNNLKKKVIEFFEPMSPPGYPWVSTKNVSPFVPAVWPAIGNMHTNVLLYYYINIYIKLIISKYPCLVPVCHETKVCW